MTKILKPFSIKYSEELHDYGNYLPSSVFVYKLHVHEIDEIDVPIMLETSKNRGIGLDKLIKKLQKEGVAEIEGASVVYEMLSSFDDVEEIVDKSYKDSNYEIQYFNPLQCDYAECKICLVRREKIGVE